MIIYLIFSIIECLTFEGNINNYINNYKVINRNLNIIFIIINI